MSTSPISAKFAKFASKTVKGAFDTARKAESMASGCPLPIGTRGIAVVAEVKCSETKIKGDGTGGFPMVMIKLEVESPEEYQGKSITGPGLMYVIKDSEKSTEAEAWGRMLDALEGLGLPREIRTEYEDFAQCIDWFTDEPRKVEYLIDKDTWAGNQSGKLTKAFAHVEEADIPTATSSQKEVAVDPEADYCLYLGKKHKILAYDSENKLYDLELISNGRVRNGVEADKVTLED
jgi:hypothetical protein